MHNVVKNLLDIENNIKLHLNEISFNQYPKVIAVSKTFKIDKILPLIEHGHIHYGENKVQEAVEKWTEIKKTNSKIQLHMIGKLQTNKVKFAVQIFDYIHSVDNEKLAKKIADEQEKQKKKIKLFIQVNIGEEDQKSGLNQKELENFYFYCQKLNLDVIGLMCLPPNNVNPVPFFKELKKLNDYLQLSDLSMGMSSDFIEAVENSSTFLRIGTNIFGQRS